MAEEDPAALPSYEPTRGGCEVLSPAPAKRTPVGTIVLVLTLLGLVTGLVAVSLYRFGEAPAHDVEVFTANHTILVAILSPIGWGMALGLAGALSRRPIRFWVYFSCVVCVFYSLAGRNPYLVPAGVYCKGPYVNPLSMGLAALAAAEAVWAEKASLRILARKPGWQFAMAVLSGLAMAQLGFGAFVMRPMVLVDRLQPPAVLQPGYDLAWEITIPAQRPWSASGFWFASRDAAGAQPHGPSSLQPPPVSLDEDAILATADWIGRIRLSDGALVWVTGFDFGLSASESSYAKVTVEQSEDRVYVVAANGQGDIYAFDRGTGRPLWQARNLDFYRLNQRGVGMSVLSVSRFFFVVQTRPEPFYLTVDKVTGSVERHGLPAPDGMTVLKKPDGLQTRPYLLEGRDGTPAVLVFYAPEGMTVPFSLAIDEQPPDRGVLYALDPESGGIAWRVSGVGDWRGTPRPPERVVFDRSTVVQFIPWPCGSSSGRLEVFDAATRALRWRSDHPSVGPFVVGDREVIVSSPEQIACHELSTGGVRWTAGGGIAALAGGIPIRTEDSFVTGLDPETGREVWRFDVPRAPGNILQVIGIRGDTVDVTTWVAGRRSRTSISASTGAALPEAWKGRSWYRPFGYLLWEYGAFDDVSGNAGSGIRLVNLARLYRDGRPLFKSAGYIASAWRDLPSGGSRNFLFEETEEGHLLFASYDERAQAYHVYLLRRLEPRTGSSQRAVR